MSWDTELLSVLPSDVGDAVWENFSNELLGDVVSDYIIKLKSQIEQLTKDKEYIKEDLANIVGKHAKLSVDNEQLTKDKNDLSGLIGHLKACVDHSTKEGANPHFVMCLEFALHQAEKYQSVVTK